jgi:hypothetical protein
MRNFMPVLIALTMPLSIASCATAAFETCPPVPVYERAAQQRAADDLALLPSDSPVREFMKDYAVMRRQSALCR